MIRIEASTESEWVARCLEELGHVVEGSVRREGNDLRVAVKLIDATNGFHLWSNTYDREMKNVFQLEEELARSIAQALRPRLVAGERQLARPHTDDVAAHDL